MTDFTFELVSPEKLLVSKPVAMVNVPGGEGDYGVLAGHAPMITTVNPGVIEVFTENTTTVSDRIFVSGGFAEVTQERCTVLAVEAVPVAELNRGNLQNQAKDLADQIAAAPEGARVSLLAQQVIVEAKLQAAA